ncbi:MAG: pilus assembly protein CpaE, partial [Propionicimonas sp.]
TRTGAAALVDVDPLGGGIDLLLGAERTEGWRWPRLHGADGQLGDLRPYLPVVDQVSVVSMARTSPSDPAREPLAAIVGSLRPWHSLVVLDPGRCLGAASREAVRLAGRVLLVVTAGVRGVAAARASVDLLGLERAQLVLRPRRGGLSSALVADAVGLPVVAELPTDQRLVAAAEVGEPPARGWRRGYRRAVTGLLDAVLAEEAGHG